MSGLCSQKENMSQLKQNRKLNMRNNSAIMPASSQGIKEQKFSNNNNTQHSRMPVNLDNTKAQEIILQLNPRNKFNFSYVSGSQSKKTTQPSRPNKPPVANRLSLISNQNNSNFMNTNLRLQANVKSQKGPGPKISFNPGPKKEPTSQMQRMIDLNEQKKQVMKQMLENKPRVTLKHLKETIKEKKQRPFQDALQLFPSSSRFHGAPLPSHQQYDSNDICLSQLQMPYEPEQVDTKYSNQTLKKEKTGGGNVNPSQVTTKPAQKEEGKDSLGDLLDNQHAFLGSKEMDCDEVLLQDLTKELWVLPNESDTQQDMLREFNDRFLDEDEVYQKEMLQGILEKEVIYQVDAYYFRNQRVINSQMRSLLVDWLMKLAYDLLFQRQTLYIAIYMVDRWMMMNANVRHDQLQLIGITALFLASKEQEVNLVKSEQFLERADFHYLAQDMFELERQMLCQLDWMVDCPTINFYTTWLMDKWDHFIQQHQGVPAVFFLRDSAEAYMLMRWAFQVQDSMQLTTKVYQFKNIALVSSVVYLSLGMAYSLFDAPTISRHFSQSSMFLQDDRYVFINDLFQSFLDKVLSYRLYELLPTIQFASAFFQQESNTSLSAALCNNPELYRHSHPQFVQYATYNPKQLGVLKQLQPYLDQY